MSRGGKKLKENFVASVEANAIATPIGNRAKFWRSLGWQTMAAVPNFNPKPAIPLPTPKWPLRQGKTTTGLCPLSGSVV
jgi:hypothetical protein